MKFIMPEKLENFIERKAYGDAKIAVAVVIPEHDPFSKTRPKREYVVSYWGSKDNQGIGEFARLRLDQFGRPQQPVVGTYSGEGVQFHRFQGSSRVPREIGKNYVDVCLAVGEAGGDWGELMDAINLAAADEGVFFGREVYRNFTGGKTDPKIEEAWKRYDNHKEKEAAAALN